MSKHDKKKYKNQYGNMQYYYNPITGQQMYNPQYMPTAVPVQMRMQVPTAAPVSTIPVQGYGVGPSMNVGYVNNNILPKAQRFNMYKANKKICKRCKIEYKKMKNTSFFSFGKSISLGMKSSFYSHSCGMFK